MPRRGAPRRPVRAIVTDVDGTLTDRARRLDPRAVELVRRLTAAGIPVILATGNVLPIALALHRFLGLKTPIVAENGGVLYSRIRGEESIQRLADRSVALRAYRELRRQGIPVRRLFTDRWRESEVALEPTVSERTIRRALRGRTVFVEGTGYAIHLMQRGAGKLPALRRALVPLGIGPEDCLIVGDGDNDAAMLKAAGWAVTFPSGSPKARRSADYLTRAQYADGFVEAVIHSGVVPPPISG